MGRERYPNFRRAQRERGSYYRGPRSALRNRQNFALILALAFAAMFTAVLFSDHATKWLVAAELAYRNLNRDHAPPPGAYYSGCNDARTAGVAPIYRNEPGYRSEMDGDGDGIACESYLGR